MNVDSWGSRSTALAKTILIRLVVQVRLPGGLYSVPLQPGPVLAEKVQLYRVTQVRFLSYCI